MILGLYPPSLLSMIVVESGGARVVLVLIVLAYFENQIQT